MQRRTLGKDGLRVSALGIGLMGVAGVYGERDEAQSIDTINRALEIGVTFLDTADVYGQGYSESLIGRVLAGRHKEVQLATKCGLVERNGVRDVDGSPAHIKSACEASLRRLKTEAIDLYYLHRPDPKTPIEESVGAFAELRKAGKIRHIGLSEVNAETLRRAAAVHSITALQSEYSLFTRSIEAEILPTCRSLGIGIVPFSPVGRGLLTGTIRSSQDLSTKGDVRLQAMPRFQGNNLEANLQLLAKVEAIAAAHGATLAQTALAWLLAQGNEIVPIPGCSRRATLEENARAADLRLTSADVQALNGISAEVSGSRFFASGPITSEVDTPRPQPRA
jgi:aryl-alcohol dehydrogenase-like predicted oxidoreductase